MIPDTVDSSISEDQPFSLAHHVTYLLEQANVVDAANWLHGLHPEAIHSADVNVQRFHINRHWTGLLTSLPTEDQVLQTRNARGCLMGSNCLLEDWTRLFSSVVIPCAITMQLLTVK